MLILRANSYLKALCSTPCTNFPLFITVTWKSVFSCGQDMGSGEAAKQLDESTRKEGGCTRMHVPFRTGGSPPVCRVSRPFTGGSGPGRLSPGSCMRKVAGTKRNGAEQEVDAGGLCRDLPTVVLAPDPVISAALRQFGRCRWTHLFKIMFDFTPKWFFNTSASALCASSCGSLSGVTFPAGPTALALTLYNGELGHV